MRACVHTHTNGNAVALLDGQQRREYAHALLAIVRHLHQAIAVGETIREGSQHYQRHVPVPFALGEQPRKYGAGCNDGIGPCEILERKVLGRQVACKRRRRRRFLIALARGLGHSDYCGIGGSLRMFLLMIKLILLK
jgi:hypothetical protein